MLEKQRFARWLRGKTLLKRTDAQLWKRGRGHVRRRLRSNSDRMCPAIPAEIGEKPGNPPFPVKQDDRHR